MKAGRCEGGRVVKEGRWEGVTGCEGGTGPVVSMILQARHWIVRSPYLALGGTRRLASKEAYTPSS